MKKSQKIIYTLLGILVIILVFFLSNSDFDIITNNKLDVGELARKLYYCRWKQSSNYIF